jgi:hypothetical protein
MTYDSLDEFLNAAAVAVVEEKEEKEEEEVKDRCHYYRT